MENVRKLRDIRIVTNDKKRSILASEPNYSTKCISEDFLIMEMKKREVYMNKPIYLGQAILDISKMLMYVFWYDYLKPMYANNIKLCYMDTDSFIFSVKTDDIYRDISNDIDKWFDTSSCGKDIDRPLEKDKNKKVIGKFKDELSGKIMSEFCALRPKTYAYKLDNSDFEEKKAKCTKKCVIKNNITFKNYVDTLFNNKKLIRSQQRFRSYNHMVYTEKINKIALSANDDKRIQTSDKITTYPCGFYDNAKNELEMTIEEGQAIRDNSKVLREDACDIRKTSNDIRNELKILREEAEAIRNRSKVLRKNANATENTSNNIENTKNELEMTIEEGQAIRNNSKVLREDAYAIRKTSNNIRNELKILRKEAQAIRNNSKLLRKEAYAIKNNKNELEMLIEEGQAIRNNSKVLREDACDIRKTSNNTRNEIEILRKETQAIIKIIQKSTICL